MSKGEKNLFFSSFLNESRGRRTRLSGILGDGSHRSSPGEPRNEALQRQLRFYLAGLYFQVEIQQAAVDPLQLLHRVVAGLLADLFRNVRVHAEGAGGGLARLAPAKVPLHLAHQPALADDQANNAKWPVP